MTNKLTAIDNGPAVIHPPTPRTDAKQNALIAQLNSHLISHEEAVLEMILHARTLEEELRATRPEELIPKTTRTNDVNAEAMSILTQRAGGELFIPNGPDIKVGTTYACVEDNGVRFMFSPREKQ